MHHDEASCIRFARLPMHGDTIIAVLYRMLANILQFAADRNIDIDFDIYTERMATKHGE
jgi:hypothetical protein